MLPSTGEYFNRSCRTKSGLSFWCKKCILAHSRSNKVHINAKSKEWRRKNIDLVHKREQLIREKNREKLRAKWREWRLNNKEKYNLDHKAYIAEHKEQRTETSRKYTKNHPEQNRRNAQKRNARKKLLLATLTLEQWEQIKKYFNNRCAYCGEEIYLEQDHFIPISKAENTLIIILFHVA
jgi:5-methylcytosine-specific restriction endonuclease McrA